MSETPKSRKPQQPIPVGELVRRLIERKAATAKASSRTRVPFPPVVPEYGVVFTGRLKSHGAGSPPHRLGQYSYFVKILTTEGLKTLWGVDLKRAIAESKTRPDIQSIVGVQPIGYQVLKLPPSAGGKTVKRTRWRVERIEFFAERVRQAREARESKFRERAGVRPQSSKQQIDARMALAQTFADRHIYNVHDRQRFLEALQRKLILSVNKEPEPPTR
jgi:hypothetical protein